MPRLLDVNESIEWEISKYNRNGKQELVLGFKYCLCTSLDCRKYINILTAFMLKDEMCS